LFDCARELYNFLVFCHKIYNWSKSITISKVFVKYYLRRILPNSFER
jgi:hypothetical protein